MVKMRPKNGWNLPKWFIICIRFFFLIKNRFSASKWVVKRFYRLSSYNYFFFLSQISYISFFETCDVTFAVQYIKPDPLAESVRGCWDEPILGHIFLWDLWTIHGFRTCFEMNIVIQFKTSNYYFKAKIFISETKTVFFF